MTRQPAIDAVAPAGHGLVVGGTGMLRGACLHLAARGCRLSVVARGRERLNELARTRPGAIDGIPLDYHDSSALRAGLMRAVDLHGPVTMAVCWIHSRAPDAPLVVAEAIARREPPPRFFHVVGSAAADPARPRPAEARVAAVPGLLYRRVVLGFVRERDGSRWLSDDEIARGVIDAVERDRADTIVGLVRPWSRRP